MVSPDTVALSGGTATFGTKDVGTGKTVTGNGFGLINNADGNYVLQSATLTTTADIAARTAVGAFTADNKVYDSNTSASIASRSLTGTCSPPVTPNGVVSPDTVALSGGTATFGTKDVGTGKTVTGNGFGLINNADGNYVLQSATLTTTADITAGASDGAFTAEQQGLRRRHQRLDRQPLARRAPARRRSRPTASYAADTVALNSGGTATFGAPRTWAPARPSPATASA